ncbi:MAG: hypothetical protein VX498_06290, partial [Myxococcota bacterium]|nr:hypothetical protein [Myxococcota bacterium]
HQGQTSKAVTDAIRARAPEAILQLNHPLWGNIGLWRILGIDPATGRVRSTNDSGAPTGGSEDYDCVEVLNGKDTDNAEDVLAAWLAMLDQGLFPTAVGNSDSHRIVGQERGASRTWVEVGLDESDGPVAAVVKALKTGRATASTGPFLRLLREPGAGQLTVEMLAPDWLPVDQIELYGGDPEGIGGRSLGSWKPSSSALTEELSGGVRRWLLQVPAEASQGQDWVVAVARGTEPMLPWSEAKALAVTNPLRLPQAEAAGRK